MSFGECKSVHAASQLCRYAYIYVHMKNLKNPPTPSRHRFCPQQATVKQPVHCSVLSVIHVFCQMNVAFSIRTANAFYFPLFSFQIYAFMYVCIHFNFFPRKLSNVP